MRKLVQSDPSSTEWQSDLGWSLSSLGTVKMELQDYAGTITAYQENLTIRRKLLESDQHSPNQQRDLSASLNSMGEVRLATKGLDDTFALYTESLTIMRKLIQMEPGNAGWRGDLSWSINGIGDVRLARDDRGGAFIAYEEGLELRRKLAMDDPSNVPRQINLVVNLEKMSKASEPAYAHKVLREAVQRLQALARESKLTPGQQRWLVQLRDDLERLAHEPASAR
jgi:hypothetical protein